MDIRSLVDAEIKVIEKEWHAKGYLGEIREHAGLVYEVAERLLAKTPANPSGMTLTDKDANTALKALRYYQMEHSDETLQTIADAEGEPLHDLDGIDELCEKINVSEQ